MSASNCVTWSSGSRGAVDELGRVGGARDGRGEVGLGDRPLPHLDPLPERAQVRRGVAAGAQPVALEDRGAEAHRRRLAVGARPRGSRRSGAAAGRAPSSAGACGRARSACRTARARAGTPRPARKVIRPRRSQRLAVLLELAALLLHHLGGRLLHELLVGRACCSARSISASQLLAPARSRRRSASAGSNASEGSTCTAPPGIGTVASTSPLARRRRPARSAPAAPAARASPS